MKVKTRFVCRECGHIAPKWLGQCPGCGAWNTLEERQVEAAPRGRAWGGAPAGASSPIVKSLGDIDAENLPRYRTGIEEFDRVLGGGLVPGSLVLVAGDPGVGKSTLLLQAASAYAAQGLVVLYVSAEESERQLRLRSRRLGGIDERLQVLASTRVETVAPALATASPDVIIVDSVQTLHSAEADSAPGSVAQVRDNTLYFLELAKRSQIPVILVGHVTKEGMVAGPRVMEHMVDAVLYLEGDRYHHYRLFRAAKNRFGPTHEVGVFEMGDDGLRAVSNPSEFLLEERREGMSGSAVSPALEGTRPILLEVQALVGSAGFSVPRRVATGVDARRLAVLLAVLEKRAGLDFSTSDVFVSVAGGFRVVEPAIDLAVAMAVASSYHDIPLDGRTVVVGEVGLGGEVRRVGQLQHRLHEASKLGFTQAIVPARAVKEMEAAPLTLVPVARVDEALEKALGISGTPRSAGGGRGPAGGPPPSGGRGSAGGPRRAHAQMPGGRER
jgi:DNA repair protein RadA/Sms